MPPPDTLGTFVGRQRELHLLRCAWDEACAGRGTLVTLVGEAGIGKTRTAEELAREVESSCASVSWGRCEEAADAPGYWPWIQLLRHALQVAAEDEIPADLRAALGERLQPDAHPSETAGVRLRLFDQIRELLSRRARTQPLLLVIDDLHWADAGSLRLLEHVARDLRRHRVLILATYREAELAARAGGDDCVGAFARHALRIPLGGLEPAEVGALASARARRALDERVVAEVHAHTAGNPFFVDTVVRLLGAQSGADAATVENLRLPAEVRAAIRRHLAHLPADTHELLEFACVLGSELAPDLLAEVMGMPASLLQATLEKALQAGVLKRTAYPQARLDFAHPLIREALYQDLEPEVRRELHAWVGHSLEKRIGAPRRAHLAALAYHFWAAGPSVEVKRCIEYLCAAGAQAREGLAYEEATCQYERALSVLDREAHAGHERERLELWLALGHARTRGGYDAAARRAYETAATLARELGDDDALADAALGVGLSTSELGAPDVVLIALLEEAIARQRGPRLRARLLARLSSALYFSQDTERRERTSRQALDLARRLDDPGCLADALTRRYFALWGPDTDPAERRALAEEAVRVAEVSADAVMQLQARQWLIVSLLEQGDMQALDLELERYARVAEELRIPAYRWHLELVRATRAAMRGELAESERRARLALSLRTDGELSNARPFHVGQLYALRQLDGRLEELRGAFEALPPDALHVWRCGRARVYVELGELEPARRELELLAARDFLDLRRDVQWLSSLGLLAEVCHALGDAGRAALLTSLLLPHAGRRIVLGHGAVCFGVVDRYLGLLAETCGQLEPAIRWYEQAIEAEHRIGAQALATRARIDCARARLRRAREEDRMSARQLLRDAHRSAAALGLRALEEQAIRLGALEEPTPQACVVSAAPRPASRAVLRREGDFWTLEHGSDVARLRGSKGLGHLARLLDAPGRELHVLDLYLPTDRPDDALAGASDAGERIDARARDDYRARLVDLHDELEEAEGFGDFARVARVREEIEVLTKELAASLGLGGRLRRTGSPIERARVNVTRTLRDALDRIRSESPEVGRLLIASIRTGTYCSYDPAPEHSLDWHIEG